MQNKYSEKVMEHFLNPHNVGRIKNPSGVGKISNSVCGDVMEMTIKIEKKGHKDIIKKAKFQTFGCGAAVATSSIVTDLVKGKTLEEIKRISPQDIDSSLGNLPAMKKHCAKLALDALWLAIEDYLSRGITKKNEK